MNPIEFITFFSKHMRCHPGDWVTRIEWRYLDEPTYDEIAAEKRRDDV
jgi:hypothetical protein